VTSCVVEPTNEVAADGKKSRLAPKQQRALDLLTDETVRHGQIPPPNQRIPSNMRCAFLANGRVGKHDN
jgi:hypothetical protein